MNKCDMYPDVWSDPEQAESEDEKKKILRDNEVHERIYRATREVMVDGFGLDDSFPKEPKNFTQVTEKDRLKFLCVYGLLLADNWTDPALGRLERIDGEKVIKYKATIFDGKVAKVTERPLIIATKFADAVVAGVQEYTRNAELFDKIYKLMASGEDGSMGRPQASSPIVASST